MPSLPSLTGLRGLAVWGVVWAHTLGTFATPDSHSLFYGTTRFGVIGMSLFYVLSGFVIHYNYGASLESGRPRAAWSFFVARFARLFPLYLVVLAQFTREPFPFQDPVFGETWPYFVTLSQNWLPIRRDGALIYLLFVPAAWSISSEALLYVSYVPLAALLRKLGRRNLVLLAVLVLVVSATAFRLGNAAGFWATAFDQYWTFYLSPYCRFPEFLLGALVAQMVQLKVPNPSGAPNRPGEAFSCAALLFASIGWLMTIYAMSYHPTLGPVFDTFQLSWGFAPGIGGLIYVFAVRPGILSGLLENRVALMLGDASYSTYLLNGYVMWIFVRWHDAIAGRLGTIGGVVLMWIMIAAVSVASYRLYELPAKRLVRWALDDSLPGRMVRLAAVAARERVPPVTMTRGFALRAALLAGLAALTLAAFWMARVAG